MDREHIELFIKLSGKTRDPGHRCCLWLTLTLTRTLTLTLTLGPGAACGVQTSWQHCMQMKKGW